MNTNPKHFMLWGALIVVVAITAFMAGFYLGHMSEPREVSDISETSTPPADETISEPLSLVPEGWRRLEDYTIVIDVGILSGELRSVWVEYGLEADELSKKTPPTSQELGMGTRGEYGAYSLVIPHAELEPGQTYFYRVVAETEAGETIETGLNRFTAGK